MLEQDAHAYGLDEVVVCPGLEGALDGVPTGKAAENDDRQVNALQTQAGAELDAVPVGQPCVEQDKVGAWKKRFDQRPGRTDAASAVSRIAA